MGAFFFWLTVHYLNILPFKQKQVSEEDISEIRKTDDKDAPDLPNGGTFHDKSVTCDLGKGKTVIIRHMDEVLNDGNIDMPKDVSANDWLVVNLAKDDWVIVDYRKENEEVVEVLDRSVDAI